MVKAYRVPHKLLLSQVAGIEWKWKKVQREKFHNLPYTATHGLGRSFRLGRQAGKRQTFKAAQVRVHRFGGKRRQRATRGKPNRPALLSMCVRASCALERHCFFLLSRSFAFFYTLLIIIISLSLSLSLSLQLLLAITLDFLRRSVVGWWREWPRKWRQKGRSSTLCRMWQSTIFLTIAGSLSVARWRIHVLYGALYFLPRFRLLLSLCMLLLPRRFCFLIWE